MDMRKEDDVGAPDDVDFDDDVDIKQDSDDHEEEDEAEEDEEEEDEDEVEDKNEEEHNNEDDGKEPWTIGQDEIVNTSADDVDTMVDDQPIMVLEQCQELRDYTPLPQPLVPALRPQTLDPRP